ncbi:MAG: hypothetical protein CBD16_06335 [Betaproteobacteria bacterium TMED156]|nr:MAG: hypothetical protein CBD16_06335 [Betaproteobacteria bacterium TMED156]|tara:strand:+ start:248 stop:682 length:435 start_codon:yes stop_codon:yes gene_type:complete
MTVNKSIIVSQTQAICLHSGEHIKTDLPNLILDSADDWNTCERNLKNIDFNEQVAIKFETFTDGRGYSLASRIKERKIVKNLHAIGQINEELAYFLIRSGFDVAHFPIRINSISDKGMIHEAKKLLKPFSFNYQSASITENNDE